MIRELDGVQSVHFETEQLQGKCRSYLITSNLDFQRIHGQHATVSTIQSRSSKFFPPFAMLEVLLTDPRLLSNHSDHWLYSSLYLRLDQHS